MRALILLGFLLMATPLSADGISPERYDGDYAIDAVEGTGSGARDQAGKIITILNERMYLNDIPVCDLMAGVERNGRVQFDGDCTEPFAGFHVEGGRLTAPYGTATLILRRLE